MIQPEDDKIIVKNRYLGVNASDINATIGIYYGKPFPINFGLEGLGEVVAVGSDVKNFEIGQFVAFVSNSAFAEYLAVCAQNAVQIPSLNPEFVSLIVCGAAAVIGLEKHGFIKAKETVLITAAAGGTGHIAVQFAKLLGCHVIGTCSTDEKVQFLKTIGCDRAINYKTEDVSSVLAKEYPKGVDVIWETIGGSWLEMLYHHLAPLGRLIVAGSICSYKTAEVVKQVELTRFPAKMLLKATSISGFILTHYEKEIPEKVQDLMSLYRDGKFKVKLDNGESAEGGPFIGLDSVSRAIQYLYLGKNVGKVIVSLPE